MFTRKSWYGVARSVLSEEKLDWKKGDFLTANEISLYLNRAIAKRAEKVGEIEFVLERNGEVVDKHPLLDLLDDPNDYMTGEEFWTLYQKYKDLTGCVYIWLESEAQLFSPNRVAKMHLLRPDLMEVIFKDGEIVSFKYTKPSGGITEFSPDEIIYSYYPDPMQPFFGQSLLKAGTRAIDTEVQIAQYHSKILRNGGKIEGVFKFKAPSLTEEQIKNLKKSYEDQFAGASKSGRPLFLGGDADYMRTGLTPDELSYLAAKNMSLQDICILTGVPKPLLAALDEVKFDNADAAQMVFLRDTIRPLLRSLSKKLDERLFPDDLTLSFVDPTPENRSEKRQDAETMNNIHALTINEQREAFGYDPVVGGDTILVPFNLVPYDQTGLDAGLATNGLIKKKSKNWVHPLKDAEFRSKYAEQKVAQMNTHKRRAKSAMKKMFDAQEKRLIDALEGQKGAKVKGLFDEIFDRDLEVKLSAEAILKVIADSLKDGGQSASQMVDGPEFMFNEQIREWLDSRANLFSKQITGTTHAKLAQAFAESTEAGESRQELIKRIKDIYSGWSRGRVNVIANTEIHGSFQFGTMAGYRQSGVGIKIWAWAPGTKGGVRDEHAIIDGEEKPLDTMFSNGLSYPGDPSADPSETVSCECTI